MDLNTLLTVRETDYNAHLSHITHDLVCASEISATLRLHFVITDGSGEPRFPELARMLVRYITAYCFDSTRRHDIDELQQNALFMEARDLFRKALRTGQAGEVLIYFLLEAVLKAPQALRKMPLTTNPKEERKGSDGVHIRWNDELKLLDIFFAESKIWQSFTAALSDAFKSIDTFHEQRMKAFELSLFSSHFTILDDQLQEKILQYISGSEQAKTRITHACLIGFDWDEYSCLDDARRQSFIAEFASRYQAWAKGSVGKVSEHLKNFPHKQLRFEFFFIPFKNVDAFRKSFEDALRG